MNSIEIVKSRIKYLEELSVSMPINRAYITLTRLEEAKAILKLLEAERSNNVQHE